MSSIHPDQLTAQRLAGMAKPPSPEPLDPTTGDGTLIDHPGKRAPLVLNGRSFKEVSDIICGYAENKPPRWWVPMFMLSSTIAGLGGMFIAYLIITGIGT